jgi:Flp pilus assembly protein TadD
VVAAAPAPAAVADVAQTTTSAKGYLNEIIRAADAGSWAAIDAVIRDIAALPRAAAGNAEKSRPLNEQALQAISAERYADAVPLLGAAIELDPSNAEFRNNLGYAQLRAGNLPEAQKHIAASLEMNAARAVAWANMAEVLAEKDLKDAAKSSLKVALFLSRNRPRMVDALRKADENFKSVKFRHVIAEVLKTEKDIPSHP